MNILVVDDHEPMRKLLRNILRGININEVEEAVDGADAIRKIKGQRFDVILLDWRMPGVSGIDVLKVIKSDPTIKDTPVIMITAFDSRDAVLEAIKAGVSNYIVKPFTPEILKKKIDEATKKLRK